MASPDSFVARPDKAAAVAELTEEFRSSSAAVLTEYRGLTVSQLKALRTALGPTTSYAVVKNTLTKIAAREAGVEGVEELLAGPSAIAFVKGDPVEAARGLRDFAKANPLLVIKGGVMDGRPLSAADLRTLADLEPREVLLAKLAGAMKASLTGAVSLFAAPLAQTARLLEALRQKAEADPSVLAGGAGTPVAVEAEAAAVEAEAAAVEDEPAAVEESPSPDEPATVEAVAETADAVETVETAEAAQEEAVADEAGETSETSETRTEDTPQG